MGTLNWTVTHTPVGGAATDITSRVLSANIVQGRTQYLDPYSGGFMTLTINNSSNYASGIGYGSTIQITNNGAAEFNLICWVQEVDYTDYPGGTGLNTATITCADWVSRAGRVQAQALSLAQAATGFQLKLFEASALGPLPSDMAINAIGLGQSTASAITYTGTVTNYLNLLQTTERGYVVLRGSTLNWVARDIVSTYSPIATTIGRTTSTTQIAYQDFKRIQNGSQFINRATITSSGVATQTETNTTSQSLYGPAFYSSETVDFNATQADGNAAWIVNNFSDPASLRFEVSFTDVAQNVTALTSYMSQCWGTFNRTINLSYTVPGGSSTTTAVVMEGLRMSITPDRTEFRMSFSPLQYYQFFTLNSSTLGILNTSRLGW